MDPDPRTVRRVPVEPSAPDPADCVPPGERVETVVDLSGGWLAVSDRQLLVYRTDREPPLTTIPRPNVAGIALRRSGDGLVVRYAPRIAVYGLLSVLVGLLFRGLVSSASVEVPKDSPAAGAFGFVTLLTDGLGLLGDAAVLVGAVALVGALGALGYRLATGGRVVVVERADGGLVRCTAADGGARRALRRMDGTLRDEASDGPARETATGSDAASATETATDPDGDPGVEN